MSNVNHRYPDGMVLCDEPQFYQDRNDTIVNPTLIIEVLSPSTALIDRNEKFQEYIRIPSVQEYVLISQNQARIEKFIRQDNEKWLYEQVYGLDSAIYLPSIACTLSLSFVYNKITFDKVDT